MKKHSLFRICNTAFEQLINTKKKKQKSRKKQPMTYIEI